MTKSPIAIAATTLVTASTIVVLGLVFANPETCPADYTQEQIVSSGCNIGANIGLGLIFMLAALVLIVGLVLAAVEARSGRMPPPPGQPPSVNQPPAPLR